MTTRFTSEFMHESRERGFIHQATHPEELDDVLKEGPVAAYLGFDATAESLHVGSLVQIMWLRRLQKAGHKPIVLMGGGTTRIGDPTGKDTARQMLSDDQIGKNIASISKIFKKYLTFGGGPTDALLVNNADWLSSLNYLDFLRDYGRHFSINRMLTFDSVKLRLEREQNLTFLEFNYMILQSYDFLELFRRHRCLLQMGGGDQWGNIVSGVELVRRIEHKSVFGLTSPLIMTASGAKMGKTAQGAVWLDEALLNPFDFWQYWRNTADADVGRFLRLFTDLPLEDITRLDALKEAEINEAKKILADEVTRLCHGEDAVKEARSAAEALFETRSGALEGLPCVEIPKKDHLRGIGVVDLLRLSGLVPSNGEARRLIRGGGARLNDQPIDDENEILSLDRFGEGKTLKISAGKKRHVLMKLG